MVRMSAAAVSGRTRKKKNSWISALALEFRRKFITIYRLVMVFSATTCCLFIQKARYLALSVGEAAKISSILQNFRFSPDPCLPKRNLPIRGFEGCRPLSGVYPGTTGYHLSDRYYCRVLPGYSWHRQHA